MCIDFSGIYFQSSLVEIEIEVMMVISAKCLTSGLLRSIIEMQPT